MNEKLLAMGTKIAINSGDLNITLASGAGDPKATIIRIFEYILWFVGAIAVAYIVYAGVKYILAQGDSGKASEARTAILNAVIGVIIVVLALVILNWAKTIATA